MADGGTTPIRAGIIGFGFIGQTHAGAWHAAAKNGAPVEFAAVTDRDASRLRTDAQAGGNLVTGASDRPLIDPDVVTIHADAEAMLADESIDVIDICTPTATHVDLAIEALECGHHVLVEKPVALTSDEVARLARAASHSDRLCMPAMCMRFWPGWTWLKDRVASGASGDVLSARFERLGGPPGWSPEFYLDPAASGGAILDLHIHDVDFITYLFGMPTAVDSRGNGNHVTTLYTFDHGPRQVCATGGWINAPSFPFRMRYTVEFEHGVADFDISREHPLMWYSGENGTPIDIGSGDGYIGQIEHLASVLRGEVTSLSATVDEVVGVTQVIEAERDSLERGGRVEVTD